MKLVDREFDRVFKFVCVGILNTLLNWIIFIFLNDKGVYYIISNIIAYTIATVHSYLWNYMWVFKYKGSNQKETASKFVILNLMGLSINTLIMFILVDKINISKIVAIIITTAIVMVFNYILNKIWVFRRKNL